MVMAILRLLIRGSLVRAQEEEQQKKHLLVMAGAFLCSVRFSTREARKLACVLPPPFHHLSLKDNPARKIGPLLNCSPKE